MTTNGEILIPRGNAFTLVVLLVQRTFVDGVAVDEEIQATDLEHYHVLVNNEEWSDFDATNGNTVQVHFDGTQPSGKYNVIINAQHNGARISLRYNAIVTILEWSAYSNWQNHIPGSPITIRKLAYIQGFRATSSEELDYLRQLLQQRIAEAEAARDEAEAARLDFIAKATAIRNVTTLSDLERAKEAIIAAIGDVDTYVELSEEQLDNIFDDDESESESESAPESESEAESESEQEESPSESESESEPEPEPESESESESEPEPEPQEESESESESASESEQESEEESV